jgi:hypothetical protein
MKLKYKGIVMMFWMFCILAILACIIFLICSPLFTGVILGYSCMVIDKTKRVFRRVFKNINEV